jgi:glycosyltransferase involved in cell wall biosynthesis
LSKKGPQISVIIPVHNGAMFLEDVVQSIERQAPLVEIVVVDDGSTDETRVVSKALSGRVRYHYQSNRGPASARNVGIGLAEADLLAFLDVDDVWPPGSLQQLHDKLAEDSEMDVVIGTIQLLVKSGTSTRGFQPFREPFHSYSLGAGLFRRRVFDKIGVFDAQLRHGEDVDWFLRAREAGVKIGLLDSLTLLYQRHGDNMTFGVQSEGKTLVRMLRKSLQRRRGDGDGAQDIAPLGNHQKV